MEEKLKILLEEFRENCKRENCDTCELRDKTVVYDICDIISLVEKELGMID